MAKKNNPLVDAPVDRLDLFLRTNYRIILFGFALVIATAIITYGTLSLMEQSRTAKSSAIGSAELAGLTSIEALDRYSGMAETLTFAKDYIHFQAAAGYSVLGEKERALAELAQVSGKYTEFAENLRCDLENSPQCAAALKTGLFAPLWYYRAILSAGEGERAPLMAEFKSRWPESTLLLQLERWGY
jgi:hypothetical protein